jgi:hypothetical protein
MPRRSEGGLSLSLNRRRRWTEENKAGRKIEQQESKSNQVPESLEDLLKSE